jgi:hypothetical protein
MKKKVIITISEQYLNGLDDLVGKLKEEGLLVIRLYDYGVIVGEIEENKLDYILVHKEVLSCSEDKKIKTPPPDSNIQ